MSNPIASIPTEQLTQKELKEKLFYDLETGFFARFNSKDNCWMVAGGNNGSGYYKTYIRGEIYYLHRLAWLYMHGIWPASIDHINGIRGDNRISNLRSVTHRENLLNQKKRTSNKSGITGVCWAKRERKWRVTICSFYKQIDLGCYKDFFEACCARKSASNKYNFHANHGR